MGNNWLGMTWQGLMARGVIAVLFGITAMVWPISTALALATVWGIWALLDGVTALVQAFSAGIGGWARIAWIVSGLISLFAAVFALLHPVAAAVTLTWIFGIWLVVRGVMELVLAFTDSPAIPRGLLVLGAILDFLLGALFVANPGRSAIGLAWALGAIAIAWGITFIVVAWKARSDSQDSVAAPA